MFSQGTECEVKSLGVVDMTKPKLTFSKSVVKTLITELVFYYCNPTYCDISAVERQLNAHNEEGTWLLDDETSQKAANKVVDYFQLEAKHGKALLLKMKNLDVWAKICQEHINHYSDCIHFSKSEEPQYEVPSPELLDDLWLEAQFWAEHFSHIEVVVGTLPRHTRLGFIWTILVPKILDIAFNDVKHQFPPDFLSQSKHTLVLCKANVLPVLSNSLQLKTHPVEVAVYSEKCEKELLKHALDCGFDDAYHLFASYDELIVGYTKACMSSYIMAPYVSANNGKVCKNSTPIALVQDVKVIQDRFLPLAS